MRQPKRKVAAYVLLGTIATLVLVLDQVTKGLVRRHLPLNQPYMPVDWLDPLFTFRHVQNTGAAFGLFPGGATVFMGIAVVVVIGIIIYYARLDRPALLLRAALGLQLGGSVGNLIDRLMHNGAVTDFVDLRWFPVFNVADSAITIGTIILACYMLFEDCRAPEPDSEKNQALTA